MLDRLKFKKNDIDNIEKETEKEPIKKEDIEKAIKLIEAAKNINCCFTVEVELVGIDTFFVNSDTFEGIKLLTSKKDGDKLSVKYSNPLSTTDTYIYLEKITNIYVKCQYSSEDDVNVQSWR